MVSRSVTTKSCPTIMMYKKVQQGIQIAGDFPRNERAGLTSMIARSPDESGGSRTTYGGGTRYSESIIANLVTRRF